MGQTGIEAAASRHGARALVLESDDPISRTENLRAAIDEGASLIVVLGFEFNDAVLRLARAHPEIDFLVVDQCIEDRPANVSCARFREYEAAFLLGATAAQWTTSGHVGVIATADIPFLHRYTDAFALGARHHDPAIEVSIRWVGGENPFSDPVRAKEQTLALAATGANPIFAAAAGGNLGVFEAIRERNLHVFGLDINQCPNVPGHMIDNLIKRVDVAILDTVDALRGPTPSGHRVRDYGLDSGGLGTLATLDGLADSQCLLAERPELITAIRDLAQQIIEGSITIDDPMLAAAGTISSM